jgi:hypothetical protein
LKATDGKEFAAGQRAIVSGRQHTERFKFNEGVVAKVADGFDGHVTIRFDNWNKGHGEGKAEWSFFEADRDDWCISVHSKPDTALKPTHTFADFGIGDRVRLTDDNGGYCEAGAEGTVVESNYPPSVKVEFDKEFHGARSWYADEHGANLEKLSKPSGRFKLAWVFRGADGEVTDLNSVGYGDTLPSREEADAAALKVLEEKDNYGMEIAVLEVRAFHRSKIEVVSEAA